MIMEISYAQPLRLDERQIVRRKLTWLDVVILWKLKIGCSRRLLQQRQDLRVGPPSKRGFFLGLRADNCRRQVPSAHNLLLDGLDVVFGLQQIEGTVLVHRDRLSLEIGQAERLSGGPQFGQLLIQPPPRYPPIASRQNQNEGDRATPLTMPIQTRNDLPFLMVKTLIAKVGAVSDA